MHNFFQLEQHACYLKIETDKYFKLTRGQLEWNSPWCCYCWRSFFVLLMMNLFLDFCCSLHLKILFPNLVDFKTFYFFGTCEVTSVSFWWFNGQKFFSRHLSKPSLLSVSECLLSRLFWFETFAFALNLIQRVINYNLNDLKLF